MKLRNFALLTIAMVATSYYGYKKYEYLEEDNNHIDRCRNKLISLGYSINDSYTLNLKENSYLLFWFVENGKKYEVKYDKIEEIIIYVKGE